MARPVKLLCPMDFSPSSEAALSAAAELAEHLSGELLVLHVVVPVPVPIGGFGAAESDIERIEADREEAARRRLEETVERLVAHEVPAHPMVEIGEASDRILEVARVEEVAWIVLSTHGESAWQRWFVGSVADRVIRSAHCRVLAIPPAEMKRDRAGSQIAA
jgi:nucleotide-binding universal stress UspA family protein